MKRWYRYVGVLLLPAMSVPMTGCQTMNEHRTATGAVAGTVIGAGAGALIDRKNPLRGAAIGAAAGAAVGTGIGYMLSQQKKAFDQIADIKAEQRQIMIQPPPPPMIVGQPAPPPPPPIQGDGLNVVISSDVLYEQGSSSLSPRGAQKINEIANILKQYPDQNIVVIGYTSSEGTDQGNLELSYRRADVVKNQLMASGIPSNRINAFGMGSSNPIGDNNTETGRVRNRRVEINVVPYEKSAR